mgnify:CR=1 FL=1
MQQDGKKDQENKAPIKNSAAETPLSQTIANAHAAGDGTLERDKDTLINTNDAGKGEDEKQNEAY